MSRRPQPRLYLDVESSGLNPDEHRILEIAAIVPTDDLEIKATFHVLVKEPNVVFQQQARNMHEKSGLLDELEKSGVPMLDAEHKFLVFLAQHFDFKEKIVLAGHSPHGVDLPFLRKQMPELAKKLSHRVHDTGAIIRDFNFKTQLHFKEGNVSEHTALSDVMGALDEDRRHMKLLKEMTDAYRLSISPES